MAACAGAATLPCVHYLCLVELPCLCTYFKCHTVHTQPVCAAAEVVAVLVNYPVNARKECVQVLSEGWDFAACVQRAVERVCMIVCDGGCHNCVVQLTKSRSQLFG